MPEESSSSSPKPPKPKPAAPYRPTTTRDLSSTSAGGHSKARGDSRYFVYAPDAAKDTTQRRRFAPGQPRVRGASVYKGPELADGISDKFDSVTKRFVPKNKGRGQGNWGRTAANAHVDTDPVNRIALGEGARTSAVRGVISDPVKLIDTAGDKVLDRNRGVTCWATVRERRVGEDGSIEIIKRRCRAPALPYARVCRKHGGNTGKARARAGARAALAEAMRLAQTLGLPVEADPRQVIVTNMYHAYGMSVALAALMQDYDTDDLRSDEEQKRAQVWALQNLLGTWQERSSAFASLALKSGIEERVVQLAESQAVTVVGILRDAIEDAQLDLESRKRLVHAVANRMRQLARGAMGVSPSAPLAIPASVAPSTIAPSAPPIRRVNRED